MSLSIIKLIGSMLGNIQKLFKKGKNNNYIFQNSFLFSLIISAVQQVIILFFNLQLQDNISRMSNFSYIYFIAIQRKQHFND